ncbi:MAG: WG repeat-containing protein, partial [Candidatus Obscuribacterales bacterium]|nr:WG repeat-containing protein [Candidatus Obscuribacterales bacterium]
MHTKKILFACLGLLGCFILGVIAFLQSVSEATLSSNYEMEKRKPHAYSGAARFQYIDEKGALITNEKFRFADDFHEGFARVQVGPKVGFIDRMGHISIEAKFRDASNFSEGLAAAKPFKDFNYGYIDKKGEFILPPKYSSAQPFHDGRALVISSGQYG